MTAFLGRVNLTTGTRYSLDLIVGSTIYMTRDRTTTS